MSTIGELDDTSCAFRLLILLSKQGKPLKQMDLYDKMYSGYGLGRKTVESSLQVCVKAGLVELERLKTAKKQPMPSIFHSLTKKGEKVAKILLELDKALM